MLATNHNNEKKVIDFQFFKLRKQSTKEEQNSPTSEKEENKSSAKEKN